MEEGKRRLNKGGEGREKEDRSKKKRARIKKKEMR